MKIDFLCRNYEASDKLKDVITKKVDRLDKFFEDDTKVKIVLKEANNVQTMELTIAVSGGVLRAEVSGKNMYELIDQALPKLEKQIIKHHSKMKDKKFKVKDFVGETEKTDTENRKPAFSDTDTLSDESKAAIKWASENGLVTGLPDGRFAPKDNVTRAQCAAVFARALGCKVLGK